jgi:hypothetical protein
MYPPSTSLALVLVGWHHGRVNASTDIQVSPSWQVLLMMSRSREAIVSLRKLGESPALSDVRVPLLTLFSLRDELNALLKSKREAEL